MDVPLIENGRVLRDRYVIEERFGSGANGSVFKALDRHRAGLAHGHERVAIKILPTVRNHPEQLARLRREFYRAQTLAHPNIVKLFELDGDDAVDFITMESLEGETLCRVLERLRIATMSSAFAWRIIRDIGCGLAHAHAHNVVHANLTPQNIMITRSGEVRILGFGGFGGPGGPADAMPRYASCEQLEGRPADPRDDLYALACISYELLSGAHPFQRRPATLARDLGIVPRRPHGLRPRQWKMLAMGLSWHRAARSMAVDAWLEHLHAERATASRLPDVHEINAAARSPRQPPALRAASLFTAASLFAVLLVMAGTGVKITEPDPTPSPMAPPKLDHSAIPAAGAAAVTAQATRPVPAAARPVPALISADGYRVRAGEHFAEIHVHRTLGIDKETQFVWWTEAASARPGVDYVQQVRATRSFQKGKSSTSFFVRLVPNASRTQSQVFYIAIAEVDRVTAAGAPAHAAGGALARAAVWLPVTAAQSS